MAPDKEVHCCGFWTLRKKNRNSKPLDEANRKSPSAPVVTSIKPAEAKAKEKPEEPIERETSSTQRIRAEKRFKDAADGLNKVIPDDYPHIPDSVSLRKINPTDVNQASKTLENSIEELLKSRTQAKENKERDQVFITCITRWFKASFPYVKWGVETATV